jgi:hypothetical protein
MALADTLANGMAIVTVKLWIALELRILPRVVALRIGRFPVSTRTASNMSPVLSRQHTVA